MYLARASPADYHVCMPCSTKELRKHLAQFLQLIYQRLVVHVCNGVFDMLLLLETRDNNDNLDFGARLRGCEVCNMPAHQCFEGSGGCGVLLFD